MDLNGMGWWLVGSSIADVVKESFKGGPNDGKEDPTHHSLWGCIGDFVCWVCLTIILALLEKIIWKIIWFLFDSSLFVIISILGMCFFIFLLIIYSVFAFYFLPYIKKGIILSIVLPLTFLLSFVLWDMQEGLGIFQLVYCFFTHRYFDDYFFHSDIYPSFSWPNFIYAFVATFFACLGWAPGYISLKKRRKEEEQLLKDQKP